MDENVIANLVFFLLSSPALTISSPALIIPFPVNKLPNKLFLKFPKAYLKIVLFVL